MLNLIKQKMKDDSSFKSTSDVSIDKITGEQITPSFSAFGTVTYRAFIYTDVDIILTDRVTNKAIKAHWRGIAFCAGGTDGTITGHWESDGRGGSKQPKAGEKVTVEIASPFDRTDIFFLDPETKAQLGDFIPFGDTIAYCFLTEDFDVTDFVKVSLDDKNNANTYKGTPGSDMFVFSEPLKYDQAEAQAFKSRIVPIIENFNSDQGDVLFFQGEAAKETPSIAELDFATVSNPGDVVMASKEGNNFIYLQSEGYLYHDLNGVEPGFGGGGIVAEFNGNPDLDFTSFFLPGVI